MHPVEILEKISQEATNRSNNTILSVFREAFGTQDSIELFLLRSFLIDQMKEAIEYTKKRSSTLSTFENIYHALTYPNLNERVEKIAHLITNAHVTSVEAIFALQDFKQDFDSVNDISILNDELKELIETEDIDGETKSLILEICHDVDQAKFEHKITGNNAIRKLHEKLIGKLMFHKRLIESIKSSKIKEKLEKLYSKVESTNKVMNTLASITVKAKDLFELLPDIPFS